MLRLAEQSVATVTSAITDLASLADPVSLTGARNWLPFASARAAMGVDPRLTGLWPRAFVLCRVIIIVSSFGSQGRQPEGHLEKA